MAESKKAGARKQIEFAVRYQPEPGTPDGILLEYIKDNRIVPSREMVFQALRAFWLPLAYQATGELTPEEEMRLVMEAVYALDKHADYLCEYFGIDRPSFLGHRSAPLTSTGNPTGLSRRHRQATSRPSPTTLAKKVPDDQWEEEGKENSSYMEEEYDPDSSFPDD
jgi:hypothetical protein